ncbi:conjugal transfer protein TrbL family protein [Thomasclavelia cocleata]|uniref:conjugal transfer protein TrbL family protein n=1 Tax=Thomasclavelia cocleata TaxID=69824 RepID=UPI0025707611|nr:conjugal transfer protein TrbL family protein [Thomasclavelia cocleata]
MFIWDFVADAVMGQIVDWIYGKVLEFLSEFFSMMGGMGSELFNYDFVRAILEIFRLFGWALFAVGLIVAVFEIAIEYQSGRGSIKGAFLNAVKGFMAVSLFTILPVELYKFCVSLQLTLTKDMSTLIGGSSLGVLAGQSLDIISSLEMSSLFLIFLLIMMGYSIIKVFFANLKRGGILLISIAVGSLYMFSIVRGYTDGFIQWCKQIVGICLTAFLQVVILIAGLGVMRENVILGIGIILSTSEIPRIAGQFGLDTSTKANLMSTIYTAQTALSLSRTVSNVVK